MGWLLAPFFVILFFDMVDHLTPERRSWNMSRIRAKNTKPEKEVRSILHRMGYRFRIHVKDLPGTPDIVLKKYNTVIFCHGCFWHRHMGCKRATTPKTNREYWENKFLRNVQRFKTVKKQLKDLGWNVLVVWECELTNRDSLTLRLKSELERMS